MMAHDSTIEAPSASLATTELRVATWNVDGWHTIRPAQLELLHTIAPDIALLQEVTPASMEVLRSAGWDGVLSLELLPSDHRERNDVRPKFGCAILGRAPMLSAENARVIEDAPSPVRTLTADVRIDGALVHAISAALPPGRMWGRAAKTGQAHALGSHVTGHPDPVVLGMDRNGPQFEAWDPEETVWWKQDDPSFFAPGAAHGLSDVLDRWLHEHRAEMEAERSARPDGPRAVTYLETRATPPVPRRYDVLMASRHFTPQGVAHHFHASIEAGSDHGLVVAELLSQPGASQPDR